MEKYLQLNCKLRKTDSGYALTIFINEGLLKACKKMEDE